MCCILTLCLGPTLNCELFLSINIYPQARPGLLLTSKSLASLAQCAPLVQLSRNSRIETAAIVPSTLII
ncbi:hypothetical protein L1887_29841 [Cichorium endivia]|nr:hypothetical protein L1887_29841 [Cichorium endivia]